MVVSSVGQVIGSGGKAGTCTAMQIKVIPKCCKMGCGVRASSTSKLPCFGMDLGGSVGLVDVWARWSKNVHASCVTSRNRNR